MYSTALVLRTLSTDAQRGSTLVGCFIVSLPIAELVKRLLVILRECLAAFDKALITDRYGTVRLTWLGSPLAAGLAGEEHGGVMEGGEMMGIVAGTYFLSVRGGGGTGGGGTGGGRARKGGSVGCLFPSMFPCPHPPDAGGGVVGYSQERLGGQYLVSTVPRFVPTFGPLTS